MGLSVHSEKLSGLWVGVARVVVALWVANGAFEREVICRSTVLMALTGLGYRYGVSARLYVQ